MSTGSFLHRLAGIGILMSFEGCVSSVVVPVSFPPEETALPPVLSGPGPSPQEQGHSTRHAGVLLGVHAPHPPTPSSFFLLRGFKRHQIAPRAGQ
eukprot:8312514-Pyramimonas_sp.AAC.1